MHQARSLSPLTRLAATAGAVALLAAACAPAAPSPGAAPPQAAPTTAPAPKPAAKAAPAEKSSAAPSGLAQVIEQAKQEGTLKIQWSAGRLGGDAGVRQMVDAMNQKYGTGIKVQFTPGPDFPTMLNKLTQEKAAGQPASSDIFLGTSNHIAEGLTNGMLKKMEWKSILERPAPSDAGMDILAPDGAGVAMASRVVGITYNSNMVKGEDVPESMEDPLKPKWKGKIASTPFATGLYQFAAPDMLGEELMTDYTKRLAAQVGGLISCNEVDRIGSGEFAMLVFDCGHDDSLRAQQKGAPVGHATVNEVARINIIYFGVPEHAEHPNAAALFTNFLHTEQGQKLQWDLGGHDLHIYPEAQTRPAVQKVVKERGKLAIDTVQREFELDHKDVNRVKDKFVKMLKEGGAS